MWKGWVIESPKVCCVRVHVDRLVHIHTRPPCIHSLVIGMTTELLQYVFGQLRHSVKRGPGSRANKALMKGVI